MRLARDKLKSWITYEPETAMKILTIVLLALGALYILTRPLRGPVPIRIKLRQDDRVRVRRRLEVRGKIERSRWY